MAARRPRLRGSKNLLNEVIDLEKVLHRIEQSLEHDTLSESSLIVAQEEVAKLATIFETMQKAVSLRIAGVNGNDLTAFMNASRQSISRQVVRPLKKLAAPPVQDAASKSILTRHAEDFVADLELGIKHLRRAIRPDNCSVIIGAYPSLLHEFMPRVLAFLGSGNGTLWNEFPHANVKWEPVLDGDVTRKLQLGKLDLALTSVAIPNSKLASEKKELLFHAEEFGLIIPAEMRFADRETGKGWSNLEAWIARQQEKPKGREPFDFSWLTGLTFFEPINGFHSLLVQYLGRQAAFIKPIVQVYTNREVQRCVELGLGIGLGHRPVDNATPRLRFVSFHRLNVKDVNSIAVGELTQKLRTTYPIYLGLSRAASKLSERSISTPERLMLRVIEAIRHCALNFQYRLV